MSGPKSNRTSHFKRRRRRGSYLGVTGKYPTAKSKHSLFYESLRERDLFVTLNFDNDVEWVEDHPFTIDYKDEGKSRQYTPDASIKYRAGKANRTILIEVKVAAQLEKSARKLEKPLRAGREYAAKHGMAFEIVTEAELPQPRVRNLRFLYPYRLYPANSHAESAILCALRTERTLEEICAALQKIDVPRDEAISQIWRLVSLQQIAADLDNPLSMSTQLEGRPWTAKLK